MKQIRATGRPGLGMHRVRHSRKRHRARAARPAVDRRVAARRRAAAGGAHAGRRRAMLQAYVGANQQVLTGQSSLASAMGLTGAAGQAQQAASQLAGGNALTPAALSQMGGARGNRYRRRSAGPSRAAVRRTARSTSRHSATASRRSGSSRSIRNCSRGRQSRFDERGVAVAVGPESAEHAGCVVYRAKRAGPVAVARDDAQPGRAVRDEPGHFGAVGRIVRAEAAAVTLRGAVRDAVPASRATRR